MTYEQAMRQRHAFRERLREFLSLAATMTNDEIEIALGRLVDMLTTSKDENESINCRLRGQALKSYYDLRIANQCGQKLARRRALSREDLANILTQTGPTDFEVFWRKINITPIEELLLEAITTFRLGPEGLSETEVTTEQVKLLMG